MAEYLVEAQSMGKPIIASNIGGSKETILKENLDFYINMMIQENLLKSLNTVIELDQEELKLMGKRVEKCNQKI